MIARLQLAEQMMRCPLCWENFVWHCQQAKGTLEAQQWSLTDKEFAEALAPWRARVFFGNDNYVEFDSEQDKLLFVLKWS